MEYVESKLNFADHLVPVSGGTSPSVAVTGTKFDRFKGLSMVLLGAVLWGVSGTVAQVLFQRDGLNPGWLVAVRMSVSGLLLLAGSCVKSGPRQVLAVWKDRRDAGRLILFGIVGLLGVQYSYFASIRYGNAATGTILQYMGPVFITVYGAWRSRRMPSAGQVLSAFLALVGALLLVTDGDFHSFSVAPLAVLWGIVSAITVAFYSLYPQHLLRRYGAAATVGWAMLIGGVGMSFVTPPWHFTGHYTLGTWGLIGFVVVFGTLIAFYVYIASLKYISAFEASVLSCGEPLSAAIIAVACLHVQMGALAMLGGVCVLVTVILLARQPAESR
ncbi:DMT family transporter [Alicyclobacillus kakegawensis]|uniref:DMT family transporter n=1 Tax=Alicyclobacillus kakegawensis TaxID=392012 RepID=UPI000A93A633